MEKTMKTFTTREQRLFDNSSIIVIDELFYDLTLLLEDESQEKINETLQIIDLPRSLRGQYNASFVKRMIVATVEAVGAALRDERPRTIAERVALVLVVNQAVGTAELEGSDIDLTSWMHSLFGETVDGSFLDSLQNDHGEVDSWFSPHEQATLPIPYSRAANWSEPAA